MSISEDDLLVLIHALEREQQDWISGRFTGATGFTQADDMTIFGPFGGGLPNLAAAELIKRQKETATMFAGGTGSTEVVKTIISGDVVVLVTIERNQVNIRGQATTQPWVLRTTQVFRHDQDRGWLRLHRHADPLIRYRPGDETFSIAAG